MRESKKLRRRFVLSLFSLLAALAVATATTMAWYIYTLNAHTTKLHMAAGAGASLQIATSEIGEYSSAVNLEEHSALLTPVSTDQIQNGFQRVESFAHSSGSVPLLANLFRPSLESDQDYFKISLYFRTNAKELTVYLANVGFQDSDEARPISSAIRVGLVNTATKDEYIFAISDKKNPNKEYNTENGEEGHVLDSTKTDGSTVEFTPLTADNYCEYDSQTGVVTLKADSKPLGTVSGGEQDYGSSLQIDVYIWLEGCDEDCTRSLAGTTLSDIALSFVGFAPDDGKGVAP